LTGAIVLNSVRRVSRVQPVRPSFIVGGIVLIYGCAVAAFLASELHYKIRPAQVWGQKYTIFLPFLPLTGVFALVAGAIWARSRWRPSAIESTLALGVVELTVAAAIIAILGGIVFDRRYVEALLLWWGGISVMFAPGWLLGCWLGLGHAGQRKALIS
jgi:hypothetical protein